MPARNANYDTMNHEARRRIRDGGHTTKQLNRIYKRDKGICQLCFKYCAREDASRDHIKEFQFCTVKEARSDDNVRLAHVLCNMGRSNSAPKSGKLPKQRAQGFAVHRDSRKPMDPLTYKIAEAFPDFPRESD